MRWTGDPAFWEAEAVSFLSRPNAAADAAHDLAHIRRVVATAGRLAAASQADPDIVLPAAWLHDCVSLPKNHPERARASKLAAAAAAAWLQSRGYAAGLIPAIVHAIEAHSFSAGIAPETLEAAVVQDADRLDALGAIGIARCFLTGATFGTPLYQPDDPFCAQRTPDDRAYILDHFYVKLLQLEQTMQTGAGRAEAARRTRFMHSYLQQLAEETGFSDRDSGS